MSCSNFLFVSQLDFTKHAISYCKNMHFNGIKYIVTRNISTIEKKPTRQQELQYEVKDDLRTD